MHFAPCKRRRCSRDSKNNATDERLRVFPTEIMDEDVKCRVGLEKEREREVVTHVGTFTRYFAPCLCPAVNIVVEPIVGRAHNNWLQRQCGKEDSFNYAGASGRRSYYAKCHQLSQRFSAKFLLFRR